MFFLGSYQWQKTVKFTEIIDCIDVSVTVDELLHHALHR